MPEGCLFLRQSRIFRSQWVGGRRLALSAQYDVLLPGFVGYRCEPTTQGSSDRAKSFSGITKCFPGLSKLLTPLLTELWFHSSQYISGSQMGKRIRLLQPSYIYSIYTISINIYTLIYMHIYIYIYMHIYVTIYAYICVNKYILYKWIHSIL